MEIASRPLNHQAIALEEAETLIRLTVQDEYIKNTPLTIISRKIAEIIKKALAKVKILSLKESAKASLINFYRRQYQELNRISRDKLLIAVFLSDYITGNKKPSVSQISALRREQIVIHSNQVYFKQNSYGVPIRKFSKKYIEENITPVYERLEKQFPLDPNDISGRNSLRNLAEMEVRYQSHLDQIADLRNKGVKLVIASIHSDCSERCAKWQGRVYSLDGTYGTTDDGRKYVPLEVATDIWYTTKAGKRYKNGLLGFNCRHYLIPYKSGFMFPKSNAQEERRQYSITKKQRELERNVRYWRTKAVNQKQVDRQGYLYSKQKAIEWNKIYIKFSKDNNRAYYPSRTAIL